MSVCHSCGLFSSLPSKYIGKCCWRGKGGHGRARLCGFWQLQLSRFCWKLQSSAWLCDTEIYSIGFQGIDCFHLRHRIPPGLSHLLLWHSLKAWSQKRTFWTMGPLFSLFWSIKFPVTPFCNYSTRHLPRPPVLKQSGNLPLSFVSLHRSPTSLCFPTPLLILTLGPFLCLVYSHTFGKTLLRTCVPEKHLIHVYSKTSLSYSERDRFKRNDFSPSFISKLKKKSWIACGYFSKHLLLDSKYICV